MNHSDPYSERMIITGLLEHGSEAYYIVDEQVNIYDLAMEENKIVYSVIQSLIVNESIEKPNISEIVTIIQRDNPEADEKYDFQTYLTALSYDNVNFDTLKVFCRNVKRLSVARRLKDKLGESINALNNLDGSVPLSEIINLAERPINEFTDDVLNINQVSNLSDNVDNFLEFLATERPDKRGIPIGFPRYERAIGGIRTGVHLLGARAKVGKSFFATNVSKKVGEIAKSGVKVLYLDSELSEELIMTRILASISDIDSNLIESGAFADNMEASKSLKEAAKQLKEYGISYQNISGLGHESWISTIRRWILKEVGFDENGNANPCLVILDYIKTMNLKDIGNQFSEWQYLGQVITDIHNICLKYDFPVLSFVQLNRQGISNDDQGVIAGSDRLMALCSSFSIMRKKEADDFTADPLVDVSGNPITGSGDRKLVVIDSRFGPGLDDGEYINICTDLAKGKMDEGYTNIENRMSANSSPTPTTRNSSQIPQPPATTKQEENDDDETGELPPF